jgi:hypothetical protein
MKRQWLHDTAKFAAGLVVADFITLWWLSTQNALPASFLGLQLSPSMIFPSMAIDFFLFLILVHYGWNIGKMPQLKERMYLTVAGVIFTIVAVVHIVHILYQGDVIIFGWYVPVFLSWLGVAVSAYLAYASFHFATRMKGR